MSKERQKELMNIPCFYNPVGTKNSQYASSPKITEELKRRRSEERKEEVKRETWKS